MGGHYTRDLAKRLRNSPGSVKSTTRLPSEVIADAAQDYGVERDGGEIVVSLGLVPPFRIPVNTAIQFALLILAKCGVEVHSDGH